MTTRTIRIATLALVLAGTAGAARADSLGHSGRASAHSGAASVHSSAAAATGAAGIVAVPLMSAGAVGRMSGAAGDALWDAANRPLEVTRDRPALRPVDGAEEAVEPAPATRAR